jgi:predicted nuclease of predicted toxin-antitoxin system
MDFKVDESLPIQVARQFSEAGHSALTVLDEGLGGQPDQVIADECKADGRSLVTLDVGFGDIRTYPPSEYAGLIVLRLRRQDRESVS